MNRELEYFSQKIGDDIAIFPNTPNNTKRNLIILSSIPALTTLIAITFEIYPSLCYANSGSKCKFINGVKRENYDNFNDQEEIS